MKTLPEDPKWQAAGWKRCPDCGAYSEAYTNTCGRCRGTFPDHTEDCPTCDNRKRADDDACSWCLMLWKASPAPRSGSAA